MPTALVKNDKEPAGETSVKTGQIARNRFFDSFENNL